MNQLRCSSRQSCHIARKHGASFSPIPAAFGQLPQRRVNGVHPRSQVLLPHVVSAAHSLNFQSPEDHWDMPFASMGMFASDAGGYCEEEADYNMVMDAEEKQGMATFRASSSAAPYSAEWLAGSEVNPDGLDTIIRQAERRQAGTNPRPTPKPYTSSVEVGAEPNPEGLATLVHQAAAAATVPIVKNATKKEN